MQSQIKFLGYAFLALLLLALILSWSVTKSSTDEEMLKVVVFDWGTLCLVCGQAAIQVMFLRSVFPAWLKGHTAPSGEASNMLMTINVVVSGLLLLYSACNPYGNGTIVAVILLLMALRQFALVNALVLESMEKGQTSSHVHMNSVEVDKEKPGILEAAWQGIASVKSCSWTQVKKAISIAGSATSVYRFQLVVTIGSSLFSMVSLGYNLWCGFQHAGRWIDPKTVAIAGLVMAGKAILDCSLSLLRDHGYRWAPEDRTLRSALVLKSTLTVDKMILTLQKRYEYGNQAESEKQAWALYLLLASTLVSFGVSLLLSWTSLQADKVDDVLLRKGQVHPSAVVWIYRVLWFAVKGGMALYGVVAAACPLGVPSLGGIQVQLNHTEETDVMVLLTSMLGVLFALSSLLVGELASLLRDPEGNFTAAHCGGGALVLAKLISCTAPTFMLGDAFVGIPLGGMLAYTPLFVIFICAGLTQVFVQEAPSQMTQLLLRDGLRQHRGETFYQIIKQSLRHRIMLIHIVSSLYLMLMAITFRYFPSED